MTQDGSTDEADRYTKRLIWALQPLPQDERLGIAGEIHSHLVDSAGSGADALRQAIRRLGPPDLLARSYIEDYELSGAVNRAAPGPLLLAMLSRGTRNAAAFLAGSAGAVCYLFATAFLLIALAKLVTPGSVGFWMRGDEPATVGLLVNAPLPHGQEVLGWTIVPLAALLAIGFYTSGSALLRRVARRLLATRG